jgi:hypothetical protein
MRPSHLNQALAFHAEQRESCGVIGAPGVGKSEMILGAMRAIGVEPIVMNLAMSDPTDLKGCPFTLTLADGTRVLDWVKQKQFLTKSAIGLFLDELFQAPVATMNTAASIILEKRIDDVQLHPDSWVVFASNRQEDKAGTNRVPSHIPNRCTVYFGPDANIDDWSEWAIDNGIDIRVVQFLRMKPNGLHDFEPNRLVNATPRQWAWVGRNLAKMPEAIRYETVGGRVGEGYSAELNGFIKIADQLPPKEAILLDPKRAPVPEETSALFLVTGMLAQAASATTFDSIATYMERVPPEFQAMLVKDAIRQHGAEITSTKAFVNWGVKFAEVLR